MLLTFLNGEHPFLSPELQHHFGYQTIQPQVQPHLNLTFPCLPSGPGLVERLQCVYIGVAAFLFSWLSRVICVKAVDISPSRPHAPGGQGRAGWLP